MASIKDAFEEALQDQHAIWKYVIFAIPVYFCVQLYLDGAWSGFWALVIPTYFLLFGFMSECTANVRNGKDAVLPSFNVFKLFWAGLKGTVALGPSIAINCWLASLIANLLPNFLVEPKTCAVFQGVVWALFGAIILTGYLCYAKRFRILDAYNLKTISESCVDILVAVLFMLPQVAIANALLLVPVTYIIWIFLGIPHPVAIYYWCMVGIFNLAMCGHYLAQVDYEIIGSREDEQKDDILNVSQKD